MVLTSLLPFPDFNIYSTPLLLLVLQGLIFVVLLLLRYARKRNLSDLFLGSILLVICYEQICYTVGFLGWYNVFRNTKINYWLIPLSTAVAPLIYLYVKSITTSFFRFKRRDWWHFAIAIGLIVYRVCIYTYDALQSGFAETQNGYLKIYLDEAFVLPSLNVISFSQMLLYLAFTFQLFYQYRKKLNVYFSNTYALELRWILIFLITFTLLFVYSTGQDIIGSFFMEMNYSQRYGLNIFMALVVLFIGVKGYFTDTTKLKKLQFSFTPQPIITPERDEELASSVSQEERDALVHYMNSERPYLDPELNLITLSRKLNMSRSQLSHIINDGFDKNFNDFVNEHRIEAVKQMLISGKQKQLSLLGIAMECGFNSKATFNRVFKKMTGESPTMYLDKQSK
jgi:AraC-like DNA-binding protein